MAYEVSPANDFDAERVELLVSIMAETRQDPDLKPIFDEARKELMLIASKLVAAKAKAEEEAKEHEDA